jgi:Ni/Co efflux regulator RcnB
MKTKILIAVLAIGLFTTSKALAQEKEQAKMEMKMDSTKMNMNHDSMEMKMDSTKTGMNHDQMAKTYVCPMHAKVTSDKAGECPKCGMTMVEKKMDAKMDMEKGEDTPKNKSVNKNGC